MKHDAKLPQRTRKVQVVAVVGKGGVGKTNVAVNMGVSLSQMGKTVFLLDADFGLPNVDIMLGLQPTLTLANIIESACSLEQIILKGPSGLNIVPSSKLPYAPQTESVQYYAALIHAFDRLTGKLDTLIIDTAAGISDAVIRFAVAAYEIVIVISDESASIADSYALIKMLHQNFSIQRFRIIVNMSSSLREAKKIFAKLTNVTDRYLHVVLHFLGWIPEDELVRKAIKQQCAVVEAYPSCKAAQCFNNLAQSISKLPLPKVGSGHVQFFIEQLINPKFVVQ